MSEPDELKGISKSQINFSKKGESRIRRIRRIKMEKKVGHSEGRRDKKERESDSEKNWKYHKETAQ